MKAAFAIAGWGLLLLLRPPAVAATAASFIAAAPAPAAAGAAKVGEVVELLEELKNKITKDGENEQKLYDKYACWCESVTGSKANSIVKVKDEIRKLGNIILQQKGGIATLVSEIAQLVQDIKENEAAQEAATTIRQKENAAFMAEKANLEQATAALESAIIVLGNATGTISLLRRPTIPGWDAALQEVESAVQRISKKKPSDRHLLMLRTAIKTGYTPQSGTIQGILQNMYDTFTSDLETEITDEAKAHRSFEDLIATYQSELITLQESIVKKEKKKVESETILADAEQGYTDSEEQLASDIEFFDATKAACTEKSEDWSTRTKMRDEELAGIKKAIEILSDDDARDTFGKAIKPGYAFLQVSPPQSADGAVTKALDVLRAKVKQTNSHRLETVASILQLNAEGALGDHGHFDTVIKSIDDLIVILKDEQADDDKKVKECKEEYQDIASKKADFSWKIENNDAKIDKLGKEKTKLEGEHGDVITELGGINTTLSDMEAERIQGNADYLQAKSDDNLAIKLLKDAKDEIMKYYEKNNIKLGSTNVGQGVSEALLQHTGAAPATAPAPHDVDEHNPPEFKISDGGNRKLQTKGVIGILENIIGDLERELELGMQTERESQEKYEEMKKAAEDLYEKLDKRRINLEGAIAGKGGDITIEKGLKQDNEDDLQEQVDAKTAIETDCEWMYENVGPRKEKRNTEMEGLVKAKEYLLGARPQIQMTALKRQTILKKVEVHHA